MYACFMTRDRSTNERLNGKVKRIKQEVNYGVRNVHISRKVGQIQRRYARAWVEFALNHFYNVTTLRKRLRSVRQSTMARVRN